MKNAKFWVVLGVRGNSRSSVTQPSDRAHTTSYSTLIEPMGLSCTVFELQCVFRRKRPILTHPTCICRPVGVIPFEFRPDLWHQKTRVAGLSCGIICVILCLAILIQYHSVTDIHTHRPRRQHIPRLAQHNCCCCWIKIILKILGGTLPQTSPFINIGGTCSPCPIGIDAHATKFISDVNISLPLFNCNPPTRFKMLGRQVKVVRPIFVQCKYKSTQTRNTWQSLVQAYSPLGVVASPQQIFMKHTSND